MSRAPPKPSSRAWRSSPTDEVRVRVIHAGVGAISKSDVSLADASNAIIIGFNVRPDAIAKAEAEQAGVEMRMYRVIYDAINDVSDAMKGMLAPKIREVALGEAQVRQVYKISSVGTVAGCRVTSGKITRDAQLRLVRDGIVICEDAIASLKRFKDDAKEVAEGFECGITLAKFSDIKEGDVFECFKLEEYRELICQSAGNPAYNRGKRSCQAKITAVWHRT